MHVQYRVYGAGEPALVFIHGWSCDSNYWREQLPAFDKKYTLVTVDLAGHGGTDGNRTEWSMARFGQDVATALSAVPNKQIILVGHSMGGPVAIEAARLLKGRVIGIIGVDTFKSIGAPSPSKAQVDAALKPFEADFIGQTRSLVADHLFVKGANPQLAQKDRLRHVAVVAARRRARRCAQCSNTTSPNRSRTSRCPSSPSTRISASPSTRRASARCCRSSAPSRCPATGHFLMMEDPQRFNPALETEVAAMAGVAVASPRHGRSAPAAAGTDERARAARPARARAAAHRSRRLFDQAFAVPGTKWRFGLDALFGLVPGLGDIAGGIVAVYALRVARNLNAPPVIQLHMLSNIALDALIGMVPILGDLFDFAFKAQTRNLALLDDWVATPHKTARRSRRGLAAHAHRHRRRVRHAHGIGHLDALHPVPLAATRPS